MRSTYRVLSYIIAAEVVVQASMIAFAVFGLTNYIDGGGTLDKASLESDTLDFTGIIGFVVHGINGQMVIPLLALILLILSFFAKVPGGSKWAGGLLGIVVLQVLLGLFAHGAPGLGILHGINALVLFAVAVTAGRRTSTAVEGGSRQRMGLQEQT
jgi:hypothetical protein